jgi:ankyrin repeat protein
MSAKFLKAVKDSDEEKVIALLKENKDVIGATNNKGQTGLHLACQAGDSVMISLLLENNSDVNSRDNQHHTPLVALLTGDDPDCASSVIPELLAKGADPNSVDKTGTTPLLYACQSGDREAVAELVKGGAKVDAVLGAAKTTSLHLAVGSDSLDLVSFLLARKDGLALINTVDATGRSPLDYAGRNPEIAAVLVSNGGVSKKVQEDGVVEDASEESEGSENGSDAGNADADGSEGGEDHDDFKPKDVADWLQHHNLSKLLVPFKRAKIELCDIPTLSSKDIAKMGLEQESKKALLKAIGSVDASDFPSPPSRHKFLTVIIVVLVLLPIIASMFINLEQLPPIAAGDDEWAGIKRG